MSGRPKAPEEILRTLTVGDLANGGQLNAKQQARFLQLVDQYSVMLSKVRQHRMENPREDIDRMQLGEPITTQATENVWPGTTNRPVFDRVQLNTSKLQSAWNITTETFWSNIEQDNIDESVMQMMSKRAVTDLEWLAIQGDSTLGTGTPLNRLLRTFDGWDIQTNSSNIVECNGASIRKEVWAELYRSMPESYLQDPDLNWFASRTIMVDWLDTLADRMTASGEDALRGLGIAPFGIPVMSGPPGEMASAGGPRLGVPLIPSNQPLTVTEATPGATVGTRFGPFEITTGTNDAITLNIDAAGNIAFVLTAGVYMTTDLVAAINTALLAGGSAACAKTDGFNRLVIESTTTGAASSVAVVAVANSAYATIGLTAGVYTGAAAGGGGQVNEGSFIWLANPQNFIWGILAANDPNGKNGTRIFVQFNQKFDRIEVDMYNAVCASIENTAAIVKGVHVRRKSLL